MYVLEVCRCIQNPARHIVAGQCGHLSCPVGHKYPPQSRSLFFFSLFIPHFALSFLRSFTTSHCLFCVRLPLQSRSAAFVYHFHSLRLFLFFYLSLVRSLALCLQSCLSPETARESTDTIQVVPSLSSGTRENVPLSIRLAPWTLTAPSTKRPSTMG